MIRAYDTESIRRAEAPLLAATPQDALMQHAATAVATTVLREIADRGARRSGSTVLLLVGGGNNGGDALYAGAVLARRGLAVTAALCAPAPHARGLAAARRAGVQVVDVGAGDAGALDRLTRLGDDAGVWVDGLTGIGARGPLRAPVATVVAHLDAHRGGMPDEPVVVAVDVPSGIGVDDGTVPGPVLRADVTVSVGATKPGLLVGPAAALAGRLVHVDIGLAPDTGPTVARLTGSDVADLVRLPVAADHKYTRGVLGLVAGSSTYPGAAVLAAAGALGAGLGMLRLLAPPDVVTLVHHRFPEVVVGGGRTQAWATGSGIDPTDTGRADDVRAAIDRATTDELPIVLDAGALALLPDRLPATAVLTPHAGELARLLVERGEDVSRASVDADPLQHARRAAELTGAVVLLKGATTIVVAPSGPAYAQADGTPWLATAGTGDVLAGVLGALLAGAGAAGPVGAEDVAALAAAAALVHGRAGRLASRGGPTTARRCAEAVPDVLRGLLTGDGPEC